MAPGSVSSDAPRFFVRYEFTELIDLKAADNLLRSSGMEELRKKDQERWVAICDTIGVARLCNRSIRVRYSHVLMADDSYHGRLRADVDVIGNNMYCTPYVYMKREARAALTASIYLDVDIVNCAPNILSQTLKTHDISCESLQQYVKDRNACIADVMTRCSVSREHAKELFVRIMFMGSIQAWMQDHDVHEPPSKWVETLSIEIASASMELFTRDEMANVKRDFQMKRTLSQKNYNINQGEIVTNNDIGIASQLAYYIQSIECRCICALIQSVQSDNRQVGAIIYDGILLLKENDQESMVPVKTLRKWCVAIKRSTGFDVELSVKPIVVHPEWQADVIDKESQIWDESWMGCGNRFSYMQMKTIWEQRSFKVINNASYVRQESDGTLDTKGDGKIREAFRHLKYWELKKSRSGINEVITKRFIDRWLDDPGIRVYKTIVNAPPPMTPPNDAFNIWTSYAVQRYNPMNKTVDTNSTAVQAYLQLINILCCKYDHVVEYVLNWIAQLFQEPAKKRGIALLLVGAEGVGKNRLTDLLREMVGRDKCMQTANPAQHLYNRFTSQREGKMLIVVNEANGADNFAANDILKDLITSDTFICEGKGTNAYEMACFARIIFTTNNENAVKVNPDSRRYVVIQVSSQLKGNTAYFNELSKYIEDEHGRYEFFRFLMERKIDHVDWINDRPVTHYTLQMFDMNLSMEFQFIKDIIMRAYCERKNEVLGRVSGLLQEFIEFIQNRCGHNAAATTRIMQSLNEKKFGLRLSSLAWNDTTNSHMFKAIVKDRDMRGVLYKIDTTLAIQELKERRWMTQDELNQITEFEATIAQP